MRIVNVTDGTDEKKNVDCVYVTFEVAGERHQARIAGTSSAALAEMAQPDALALVAKACDEVRSETLRTRHPLIGLEVALPSEADEAARVEAAKG